MRNATVWLIKSLVKVLIINLSILSTVVSFMTEMTEPEEEPAGYGGYTLLAIISKNISFNDKLTTFGL